MVHIEGGLLPFNHPPMLLPLLRPILDENVQASYYRWMAVNLVVLVGCAWLSFTYLRSSGINSKGAALILVPLFLLMPLQVNLYQGQDILFVLLGLLLLLRSIQNDMKILGGLGAGLTAISPHLALIFAFPWFFSKRNRFWYIVLGGAAVAAFSILLVRFEGMLDYLAMLSGSASAEGSYFGINKIRMVNFTGFVLRFWRSVPASFLSFITWGGFIGSLIGLAWLHHKNKDANGERLAWLLGFSVLIGLFFAPHLHVHSLLPIWISFLVWASNSGLHKRRDGLLIGSVLLFASLLMTPFLFIWIPLRSLGVFAVIFIAIWLYIRDFEFSQTGTA